ncbi:50S ribosomal protein L24 [Candidatus Micrarchaeota archaeon RBG_16_36_9]|nr:50S ribosomal protein L24, large subunit ribosomal protein L24 [uncultured archaeon]OGI11939.1 MAG: 50S ribosomal protein L24 [Candidatus Micrarchaeota archaeon RBG_16_36_9]
MKSKKPNKQRKYLFNAPMHKRHKFLSAHLAKDLIAKWNRRSLSIRKGDEVKVMRGKFKGTTGKISDVDIKRLKVYIENVKRRKVSGEEVHVPVSASNLLLINPVMDDKERLRIISRKGVKV